MKDKKNESMESNFMTFLQSIEFICPARDRYAPDVGGDSEDVRSGLVGPGIQSDQSRKDHHS